MPVTGAAFVRSRLYQQLPLHRARRADSPGGHWTGGERRCGRSQTNSDSRRELGRAWWRAVGGERALAAALSAVRSSRWLRARFRRCSRRLSAALVASWTPSRARCLGPRMPGIRSVRRLCAARYCSGRRGSGPEGAVGRGWDHVDGRSSLRVQAFAVLFDSCVDVLCASAMQTTVGGLWLRWVMNMSASNRLDYLTVI